MIQVPTIDQENAIPGIEPNETMRTFRSGEVLRPSHKNKRQVVYILHRLSLCSSLEHYEYLNLWRCYYREVGILMAA